MFYPYFKFDVYFSKIFITHKFWKQFLFCKIFASHIFWANLVPKSDFLPVKSNLEVPCYMLITIFNVYFFKIYLIHVFWRQIWSQNLKIFKLTEIWYMKFSSPWNLVAMLHVTLLTLLYPYYGFNINLYLYFLGGLIWSQIWISLN